MKTPFWAVLAFGAVTLAFSGGIFASTTPQCRVDLLYQYLMPVENQPSVIDIGNTELSHDPATVDATVAEMRHAGLYSEQELEMFKASITLAPLLQTKVLNIAFAETFAAHGYTTPKQIRAVFEHLRARTLKPQAVTQLLSEIIERLPKDLPIPDLDNLDQVERLRSRYGLTPNQYQALAGAVHAPTPEARERFHTALLWTMIGARPEFVRDVMARRSWWRRTLEFLAGNAPGISNDKRRTDPEAFKNSEVVALARGMKPPERLTYLKKELVKNEKPISDHDFYQLLDLIPTEMNDSILLESDYVREVIEREFGGRLYLVPRGRDLDVLLGALENVKHFRSAWRFERLWPNILRKIRATKWFGELSDEYRVAVLETFYKIFQRKVLESKRDAETGEARESVDSARTGVRVESGQGQGSALQEEHESENNSQPIRNQEGAR